ncbi:hypothetical protein [Pelosinus sp. UFO1]|uniref:hypothetical protein n=1 Tax=Pelosinus sp. UFO1 TaxID=484770 RepID=UPI000570BC72|nr:hypothetical protein [Pelosinus sp. UFO1]
MPQAANWVSIIITNIENKMGISLIPSGNITKELSDGKFTILSEFPTSELTGGAILIKNGELNKASKLVLEYFKKDVASSRYYH